MKKTVSVMVILSMLATLSVNGTAKSKEPLAVPSAVITLDRIVGTITSVFSRHFGFSVNDDNVETAMSQEHSWTEFDSTGFVTSPETELTVETWKAVEVSFKSLKQYDNPFTDVDVDLILAGNGRKYVIPGFWDGGNTWKVRFACPSEGTWYYKTECTDKTDAGLEGRTGKVTCNKYSGDLEIYKHGFVTTDKCKKYFTYDDGTPFLYLGDTHWSLGGETLDMVETMCKKRASQGFNVIQSEPIDETFSLQNGVGDDDLPGFADYDAKFKIIADNGLTHANAEFFYPYYMDVLILEHGGYTGKEISDGFREAGDEAKAYLERLTRYWVARYSAYPVMWTLGQEVDNDFYWSKDNHGNWNAQNNPYRLVAEYIDKYDAYDHPLSAHQENAGATSTLGSGIPADTGSVLYRKNVDTSAFINVTAHTWYAAQWCPSKTSQSNFNVEKDYWYNSQGKPSINYEGNYCYLWTKDFGARMQSWCAYLNGMYGYGWGGHDTWSYLNVYDEDTDSNDGVDTITSEEKTNATWQDSLEYPSSYQSGYARAFLEKTEWWNLSPRFNDKSYFAPSNHVFYCAAGNEDNTEAVIYFYSFSDETVGAKPNAKSKYSGYMTGTIGNLVPGETYKYQWFNPVTGETSEEFEFTANSLGTYSIGPRQWNGAAVDCDMVFHMYK